MSKSYERFKALRKKTMSAIHNDLNEDPFCKSYEGSFEIAACYPNYFEDETGDQGPDAYCIRLHCYVLGPNRHYEWFGQTLDEALDSAEEDLNQWIGEVGHES